MTTDLLISGQRKISYLFAACFFFLIAMSIGCSSAIVYRLAALQSRAHALHDHAGAVNRASQQMLADVSGMHDLMLRILVAPDAGKRGQVSAALQALNTGFRQELGVVSAESGEFGALRDDIARQLDALQATYARMLDLIQGHHPHQALALGMKSGIPTYTRLNSSLAALAGMAEARTSARTKDAARRASEAVRSAWWMLGALALFNVVCGAHALRRISRIMKDETHLVARLRDNEERLQLALAGGNQGTWDLDVATEKLTFDAEWGNLLGYRNERERPTTLQEWAAKIFEEDRDRVLKAVHDHIQGRAPEYRAEYRIRDHADELKWVAGHGKAMARDDNGIATRVVGITQDITQRKLAEENIWNLAHTDILTGLPNRVLLYDRLTQMIAFCRRHGQMFALFFLDLDGFKEVNDRYGHDIGDKLLQQVATRLRDVIRSEDTMARVGGDEFIFLLSGIHAREGAMIVADKILALLQEEFLLGECRCTIGGSLGIALFPEHSDDMDTLVSRADDAMYQAKARGKNNYQFYQPASKASSAA